MSRQAYGELELPMLYASLVYYVSPLAIIAYFTAVQIMLKDEAARVLVGLGGLWLVYDWLYLAVDLFQTVQQNRGTLSWENVLGIVIANVVALVIFGAIIRAQCRK